LFLDTCKVLGHDPDSLTLAQRLRVDRASALRLEIDDLQAAQLGGRTIDIKRLIEASEALEKLVNTTPNGDGSGSDKWETARVQFEALLNTQIERAAAAREREETSEAPRLREENANLLEENARLRAQLKQLSTAKPPPTQQADNNVVPMSSVERANSDRPPLSGPAGMLV
jgi:hypothetical protein